MDARAILENVAHTYARLKTLSVEITSETESGDEASSNRGSRRARAWFEAPDKIRIEQSGQNGMLIVTDGAQVHSYAAHLNRYFKRPLPPEFLPGVFQPRHALFGSPPAFLFSRVAETISSVELIEETPDSVVLSVVYEPNPGPRICGLCSPLRCRIDSRTSLITRIEAEVSRRIPAHDETRVSKHSISFVNAAVNEPLLAEIFRFVFLRQMTTTARRPVALAVNFRAAAGEDSPAHMEASAGSEPTKVITPMSGMAKA